ncbi:MAG TPA: flagellar hook-basal body protein [Solirubrobacteraceae bacterium]|jgi:flagellar basal-body rod protein FlgG|nr:flagellar hook-basal body protein [Solirubrobacteraceae bacterium]
MDPGLYIAASGMLAEQVRQNQLSNNLANASTPGYEPQGAEQQSFGSLLLANTATGQPIGALNTGVTISRVVTAANPTPLRQTGQPLDFGISGQGYFSVRTAAGVRYTRDGQFASNNAGQLVDQNGNLVLGSNGQPITVSAQGTVSASQLQIFNVNNPSEQGNNLVAGAAAGRASGTVVQGALNDSGVDPIQTMTDMIASLRAYQAGQSAIQTIDQTMQENASSVPSV